MESFKKITASFDKRDNLSLLVQHMYPYLNEVTGNTREPIPNTYEDATFSQRLIRYQLESQLKIPKFHEDVAVLHWQVTNENYMREEDFNKVLHHRHNVDSNDKMNSTLDCIYTYANTLPFYTAYPQMRVLRRWSWFDMHTMALMAMQLYPNLKLYYPFHEEYLRDDRMGASGILSILAESIIDSYRVNIDGFFRDRINKRNPNSNFSISYYKVYSETFITYDSSWSMRPYVSLDVRIPGKWKNSERNTWELENQSALNYNDMDPLNTDPFIIRVLCFPFQRILVAADTLREYEEEIPYDQIEQARLRGYDGHNMVYKLRRHPIWYQSSYGENTAESINMGLKELINHLMHRRYHEPMIHYNNYDLDTCRHIPLYRKDNMVTITYGNLTNNLIINVKDHDSNRNYGYLFSKFGETGRTLYKTRNLPFVKKHLLYHSENIDAINRSNSLRHQANDLRGMLIEWKAKFFRKERDLEDRVRIYFTDLFQRCINEVYEGVVRKEHVVQLKGFMRFPDVNNSILDLHGKRFGDPTRKTCKPFKYDKIAHFEIKESFEDFINSFRLARNNFAYKYFYMQLIKRDEKVAIRALPSSRTNSPRFLSLHPFKKLLHYIKEDFQIQESLRAIHRDLYDATVRFEAHEKTQLLRSGIKEARETATQIYLTEIAKPALESSNNSTLENCQDIESFVMECNYYLNTNLVCLPM